MAEPSAGHSSLCHRYRCIFFRVHLSFLRSSFSLAAKQVVVEGIRRLSVAVEMKEPQISGAGPMNLQGGSSSVFCFFVLTVSVTGFCLSPT